MSIQLINLITTLFLYFLFLILFLCVDYQGLIELRTNERYISEYINFNNLLNTNFFYVTCMVLMSIYCLIRIQGIIQDILKYKCIREYYRDELNINSKKSNKVFNINKCCKLSWFNSIKLRSINVKKVKKPINSVILDSVIMMIFFFKSSNIN